VNRRERILLTGFGPFPGVRENATSKLVPEIAARAEQLNWNVQVAFDVLPVGWRDGPDRARQLIEQFDPAVVLHFGVSEAASGFVIETRAENICKPRPDAAGELPRLELLDLEGAADKACTIPCAAIVSRLRENGLPAELSEDAGGYLCNAVLLDTLARARPGLRAGFIHVPTCLAADSRPMTMADAVRGGLQIVHACLDQEILGDEVQREVAPTPTGPRRSQA
jgi:pyroglutamyl-peptidase